jgi:hypothetical protein
MTERDRAAEALAAPADDNGPNHPAPTGETQVELTTSIVGEEIPTEGGENA